MLSFSICCLVAKSEIIIIIIAIFTIILILIVTIIAIITILACPCLSRPSSPVYSDQIMESQE